MELRPRTRIARRLRRDQTEAEKRLWWVLRELPGGYRFRRQHPIGGRIVDFACPRRRLVIELDGGQHALETLDDEARTSELARLGYRVIRFWNNDVLGNTTGVVETILRELEKQ